MSEQSPLLTPSAKLKKAILWMSDALHDHPEKRRLAVIQEAELRFDLTPAECDFLDKHFSAP
jgi:hypothetical protein